MSVVFIGDCTVDEYYMLQDHFPSMGEKCFVKSVSRMPGGMIANAACVFAQYNHFPTYFITSLAKQDPYTPNLIKNLQLSNLGTDYIQFSNAHKNISAIIMCDNSGKRAIFVVDAYDSTTQEIPQIVWSDKETNVLKNASFIYTNRSMICNILHTNLFWDAIQKYRIPLFFDVDVLSHMYINTTTTFIKKARIVSTNEYGAQVLSENSCIEDVIHQFFIDSNLEIFIVTKGSQGAEVYTKNRIFKNTSSYIPLVKDTTGAGDCFNATFLFCILSNASIEESLTLANKAGAYATTFVGSRKQFDIETIKNL